MKKEIAIKIAKEHVNHLNQENSMSDIIKWKISNPVEFSDYWYFDYEFENLTEDEVNVGGAPGYIITKSDGSLKILSWQEFQMIQKDNEID
ncbi:hypothetical protein [Catalinimonas niigatensis]|uniref:hypothetical protein n=1 Tax=Catalinimonas niigatensis TaxID=1397264 RepID=UPI002665E96C|nr:hypothetical protein [Catalinimonas niigatensis]WPP51718.1 hypothetical protein PZB72_04860 [Catalinimonas niigatensis]